MDTTSSGVVEALDSEWARGLRRLRAAPAAGIAVLWAVAAPANAHVRWFTTVADPSDPPLPPIAVFLSPLFLALLVLALAAVAAVHRVDVAAARGSNRLTRWVDRLDARMTERAASVLRVGVALYFVSIAWYFRDAPIILTPELKSPTWLVIPLQLLIASGMLFRASVIPACGGMVLLYVYAATVYGLAHLLDYHLFIGVCVFLSLDRVSRSEAARSGLLVLRLLVASSFIWVGIEKWLYPHWTQDILQHQLPVVLMGMTPAFWTTSAAFVEVTLAFLMLFGGISAQVAALVLLVLMGSAIPLIGPVDAIAHLPMLFALLVLATTRTRLVRERNGTPWKFLDVAALFAISVAGAAGLYFLTHEFAAEPVPSQAVLPDVVLSAVWVLVLFSSLVQGTLRTVRARLVRAPASPMQAERLSPSRVRRIRALSVPIDGSAPGSADPALHAG